MKGLRYLLTGLVLVTCLGAWAQEDDYVKPEKTKRESPRADFWDRIYLGGNLGAQFGNYTYVDISPLVGYRITDRWSAGVGGTYRYFSFRESGYRYSASIYGGRVFSRFNVVDFLFVHGEYEMLSTDCISVDINGDYTNERVWVPGLLLGGGLRQPFGDSASGLYIMGLYNVLYTDCSPYASPLVLQIGVAFGL